MTDKAVTDTFGEHAARYDGARRRLVPPFESFYGTAVEALDLAGRPVRRVLDLGAGTGLLAKAVLAAHPDAEVVLLDGAQPMLAHARARLGARARYVLGDLEAPLPAGPWDAVVSALAIHHLDDGAKRTLLRRVHDGLAPGGIFANAEQVAGASALFEAAFERWHEREARASGATDDEWAASLERRRHDRCATVEAQLAWLRDAGFTDADCLFRQRRFAVLVARR